MKFGLTLPYDAGVDALYEQAKTADAQGFDSIWLPDHLTMPPQFGEPRPDAPLDNFTVMTALGAVTTRVRVAWSMLNPSFRKPAVLAKMIATLDLLTHGRVICALGAGNNPEEYDSYDLDPYLHEHDDRTQYGRETVQLLKQLWTHPAPERTTFDGKFVQARNLPFNPAPYQKPHPPIWVGGDSPSSLETVKQYADGWVMLFSGLPEVEKALAAPDWPRDREMTLVKSMRIYVADRREDALDAAKPDWERGVASGAPGMPPDFETFRDREIIGDANDCLDRLTAIERVGINYLRLTYRDAKLQENVARLLIPQLDSVAKSSRA